MFEVTGVAGAVGTTGTAPWRYAIGMFGTSIPITMVKGSMILFYVDILGLDVRAYGVVMAVYAVVDALDNPLLGHLPDRTRTRYGRRRPWLLVGAPLLALGLVGFFWVPDTVDGVALVLWFAVFAVLCEAADSLLNANYGALLPELFPTERRRARANSLRQGFQLVALVVSLALTPLLTTRLLGTEDSVVGFRTAVLYAVVATVAIVVMALGAQENPAYARAPRSRFLPTVLTILRSPLFWQVGVASACYLSAMALVLSGIQLYVRYSLGLPVAYALYLQGAVILVAAGALAGWTRVVAQRGAAWTWRLAFAVLAVGFVPLLLADGLATALPAGLLLAVGWSGMLATNDLVVARVLDHDAAAHGQHREGLFLSAFGVLGRLNGVLGGAALASVGLFFGYYSGNDPGRDPALAFRVYTCAYPLLLVTVGAVLARVVRAPADTPLHPAADEAGAG